MIILLNNPGSYTIRVNNPDGGQSNTFGFSASAATSTPSISSISPANPTSSGSNQTVTVYGNQFQSGLTVTVGYSGGSSTLSGSQIQSVTANSFQMIILLNNPGSYTIRVNNPDGGQSNTFAFSATSSTATPVVTSITPTSVPASTFMLTINGTGFDGGAIDQIYYGGALVGNGVIQNRTSAQLVVQEGMASATPGAYTVKVKNSDGTLSNGVSLTIIGSGPLSGTLKANPTTCQVTTVGGNCSITLPWTLQNTTLGLITVTDALGNQEVVNPVTGSSGT
jgi:hypothetical protein